MEITPEIEAILLSQAKDIKEIELTYKNDGKVRGTIRKIRKSPLRMVVQKSDPEKGERPRHKVVFDHLKQIRIVFSDEAEAIF